MLRGSGSKSQSAQPTPTTSTDAVNGGCFCQRSGLCRRPDLIRRQRRPQPPPATVNPILRQPPQPRPRRNHARCAAQAGCFPQPERRHHFARQSHRGPWQSSCDPPVTPNPRPTIKQTSQPGSCRRSCHRRNHRGSRRSRLHPHSVVSIRPDDGRRAPWGTEHTGRAARVLRGRRRPGPAPEACRAGAATALPGERRVGSRAARPRHAVTWTEVSGRAEPLGRASPGPAPQAAVPRADRERLGRASRAVDVGGTALVLRR